MEFKESVSGRRGPPNPQIHKRGTGSFPDVFFASKYEFYKFLFLLDLTSYTDSDNYYFHKTQKFRIRKSILRNVDKAKKFPLCKVCPDHLFLETVAYTRYLINTC